MARLSKEQSGITAVALINAGIRQADLSINLIFWSKLFAL